MNNTSEFTVGADCKTLLKDGKTFFVSTFIADSCKNNINVGCVAPESEDGMVFIGTGGCCEGYVIAIVGGNKETSGKIYMIQGIDFNVHHLNPIIFTTKKLDSEGHETISEHFGLLATGAGCSGTGVRFIDFKAIPTVIPIVPTDEELLPYERWFSVNPLKGISDIWERLEKNGINVVRDRTLAMQRECSFFTAR